jgi:fumarylacetoacetase
VRPQGQILQDGKQPILALTKKLDFELELGIWIGPGNALGYPIPIREAANHIAGFCLLNDWSARDLQAWEYQPLGPFLSKSFQTTISPWIVSPEALTAHRAPAMIRPEGDPRPLPYLWDDEDQSSGSYRIRFHVSLSSEKMRNARMAPLQLAEVEASDLYWTVAQLVTHHTVNGCSLRAGDLIGTGTISSDTMHNVGSLLEFTANGQRTFTLPTGEKRAFLVDGDEIAIRARAAGTDKPSIGFGECTARVVSAPVG